MNFFSCYEKICKLACGQLFFKIQRKRYLLLSTKFASSRKIRKHLILIPTLQMDHVGMEAMPSFTFLSPVHICSWHLALLNFLVSGKCSTLVSNLQLNKHFDGWRLTSVIDVFFFELLVSKSREIVKTVIMSDAINAFRLIVIWNGNISNCLIQAITIALIHSWLVIIGEFHLKYPTPYVSPPFPISVPVIIVSVMVT